MKIPGMFKHNFETDYKTLVIVFCGWWHRQSTGQPFEFSTTFKKEKVKFLCLKDLQQCYYLDNLYDETGEVVSSGITENINFLKNIIKESKCEKVVTIGCSMGGTAACMYGVSLNVDHICAFNPQTFIQPTKYTKRHGRVVGLVNENRDLLEHIKELGRINDSVKYGNICNLDYSEFTGTLELHHGIASKDKKHRINVSHHNKFYGLKTIIHPHRTHTKLCMRLRHEGKLKKIINKLI